MTKLICKLCAYMMFLGTAWIFSRVTGFAWHEAASFYSLILLGDIATEKAMGA
jgi:hypothetical protein